MLVLRCGGMWNQENDLERLWSDANRTKNRQLQRDLEATTAKARAEERCRAVVNEVLTRH